MDAIGKELQANEVIRMKASGIKSSGHRMWRGTCDSSMRGLPKQGSMSEPPPILIQLKRWCNKNWVSVLHFKAVTDEVLKRNVDHRMKTGSGIVNFIFYTSTMITPPSK
jgi:hypothetical protein